MTIDRTARRTAVRWLSLDALKADPGNARLHSDRLVARIADSIEDEAIARPGVAWRLGSHHPAVRDEGAGGPR